jgi:hypothetical protein
MPAAQHSRRCLIPRVVLLALLALLATQDQLSGDRAHERPYFMPPVERDRLHGLILKEAWAKADHTRLKRAASTGDGFAAAFLYALDRDSRDDKRKCRAKTINRVVETSPMLALSEELRRQYKLVNFTAELEAFWPALSGVKSLHELAQSIRDHRIPDHLTTHLGRITEARACALTAPLIALANGKLP